MARPGSGTKEHPGSVLGGEGGGVCKLGSESMVADIEFGKVLALCHSSNPQGQQQVRGTRGFRTPGALSGYQKRGEEGALRVQPQLSTAHTCPQPAETNGAKDHTPN